MTSVCTENFDKVIRDVSPVLVRRGSAAQILGLHLGQSHGTLGLQFKQRNKDKLLNNLLDIYR